MWSTQPYLLRQVGARLGLWAVVCWPWPSAQIHHTEAHREIAQLSRTICCSLQRGNHAISTPSRLGDQALIASLESHHFKWNQHYSKVRQRGLGAEKTEPSMQSRAPTHPCNHSPSMSHHLLEPPLDWMCDEFSGIRPFSFSHVTSVSTG